MKKVSNETQLDHTSHKQHSNSMMIIFFPKKSQIELENIKHHHQLIEFNDRYQTGAIFLHLKSFNLLNKVRHLDPIRPSG